jgi:acyl carrier protein
MGREVIMELERELRTFVVDNFLFGQADETFSNADSFLEKGLIDSMGILTLVEFVTHKYSIVVEDEEMVPENWDSVQRIASFVQKKIGVNPGTSTLCFAIESAK